ncbi:MAG: hypothetical protein WCT04_08960, partial [Planctomycetota bacterium]
MLTNARFGTRSTTKAIGFIAVLCLFMVTAHGATITVANLNDSGAGSLRDAITAAVNGDTIMFDTTLVASGPATITLSTAGSQAYGPSAFLISKRIT